MQSLISLHLGWNFIWNRDLTGMILQLERQISDSGFFLVKLEFLGRGLIGELLHLIIKLIQKFLVVLFNFFHLRLVIFSQILQFSMLELYVFILDFLCFQEIFKGKLDRKTYLRGRVSKVVNHHI